MKKKRISKKMIIFFTVHLTLTAYMISIILFSPDSLPIIGNNIVAAQIVNAGIAAGARVADDFQRGMFFKSELNGESEE